MAAKKRAKAKPAAKDGDGGDGGEAGKPPKGEPTTAAELMLAKFGAESMVRLKGPPVTLAHGVIPTGCLGLDRALGIDGWPRGRVIEVYGPESSGKTTLCLHAVAEAQAAGLRCAFLDAEHAIDIRYAAKLGVDLDALTLSQPDSAEQLLDMVCALAPSGLMDLIIVDSVAALTPKAELAGDVGDSHVGKQARLMSQAMRKLCPLLVKTGCTVIFINQLRSKIGVTFGSPEVTTGGNALKYYASQRIDLRFIGQVKQGEDTVAVNIRAKVKKNKLAAPYTTAEYMIRFGTGIDKDEELIKVGLELGVLTQSGAYFSYAELPELGEHAGQRIACGRLRVADAWKADPAGAAAATAEIRARMAVRGAS